jgi:urease accessory protein
MNTIQPVVIDEVKKGEITNDYCPDVLELEWFETQKQKLTRPTTSGLVLELRLPHKKEWQHGDALYYNGQLTAVIAIKTCLVICFPAKDDQEAADFCYFIGNQHLPVFLISKQQFAVPYDGRLYEQLSSRYGGRIELTDTQLLSTQSLRHLAKNKAHEN